jgi:hypothetical protein
MRTTIVWFKTDLRLHDNETIIKAIAQSDQIIPVYCFDDTEYVTTEFGFKKTGSFRTHFLLESLIDLDKNLRELGSGLLILKGKSEIEIPKDLQSHVSTGAAVNSFLQNGLGIDMIKPILSEPILIVLKNDICGVPVIYRSGTPVATNCNKPPDM